MKEFLFLKSAFAKEGEFMSVAQVQEWLIEQNAAVQVNVQTTSFKDLKHWGYNAAEGAITHESGKFFSIDGIRVNTNWFEEGIWDQPIINQPEIGYLGFITKIFNGVLHFLVQAKIEPGNVNNVQLSPTLQATRSNFTQVHKGKKPMYLDYFQKAKPNQILLDQLQSEQGARFLKKRNRNIIILVEGEVESAPNFIWLTLAQIKTLMKVDNLVNMDSRTVVSGIPFGSQSFDVLNFFSHLQGSVGSFEEKVLTSALTARKSMHSNDEVLSFLTNLKSSFDLSIDKVDIKSLEKWVYTDQELYHEHRKYFKVIPVEVSISNREVVRWWQPMVQPEQEGLCAFVCKEIEGILHFIVQAKLECGNHDIVELAPTVQALTGNYKETEKGTLPFLEYVLNSPIERRMVDSVQSEEGGRFFREQNRNLVVFADDDFSEELPDKYIWLTLNQLQSFLKYNNYLNIQARTLIASLTFVK
jgi:oxidase EvaA